MVFLAGRDRYTQRTLLRAVHTRLSKQAGCTDVRYDPSPRRPRTVITDVEPATFMGDVPISEPARLTVQFWYPVDVDYEYYRLNWVVPDRCLQIGFHQDADHPDLGRCHLQLDHEEMSVERHPVAFLDAHPLAVLERRLRQLPAVLDAPRWDSGAPSLGQWSA